MKKLTIAEFNKRFPDSDACLEHIFKIGYSNCSQCPECKKAFNYTRVKDRKAYQCSNCSNQIYPTAGTVFHQSTTPLNYWFTAIYMFTTTRNGVSAKELERQLSVCYKTALRMAHQIKKLMIDTTSDKLTGEIMIDETYLGMLGKNMHNDVKKTKQIKTGSGSKIGVMGMIAKNGRIITKVLGEETSDVQSYHSILKENIDPASIVVTDAFPAYQNIGSSFESHIVVDHNKKEYVKNGHSTNRVENYWSTLKRMIKGTHIHVSKKHLSKYVAENSFRYMNRTQPEKMFDLILNRVF
jgi:transposase